MLKILWKREEIALQEQFLLLSTIFCYLMLDFGVKTRIRFSLRDKRLFEMTEVEITRVDCITLLYTYTKFKHSVIRFNSSTYIDVLVVMICQGRVTAAFKRINDYSASGFFEKKKKYKPKFSITLNKNSTPLEPIALRKTKIECNRIKINGFKVLTYLKTVYFNPIALKFALYCTDTLTDIKCEIEHDLSACTKR